MENYKYNTATGPVTIEIEPSWAEMLTDADAEEAKSNRRHKRSDHKYAPGEPVSLDSADCDDGWLANRNNDIADVEFFLDMEKAMATLSDLQQRYFILNRLKGYSYAEIARLDGKHKSTVQRLTESAAEKIKKFFN